MSLVTELHTFTSWAEKELQKIEGEAPTIERVASTVLTYVGPALQTIVSVEAGAPAGAIVGKVVAQAQSDLTAAGSLIYDFGANPSAGSIISGVSTNLSALLTAGHVTNSTSIATVTKVVSELGAIASLIPAA